MLRKEFWTDERVKAVGKIAQTLFTAFIIAGVLGGLFGKLEGFWSKLAFALVTLALFILGIVFADNPFKDKEKK